MSDVEAESEPAVAGGNFRFARPKQCHFSTTRKVKTIMIWKIYRTVQKARVSKEALQTGFLMGTGDFIAQKYIEKKGFKDIDTDRMGRFFLIGTFLVGPPLKAWYRVLHKYLGSANKVAALKKVALDQLIFAPVFLGFILGNINFTEHFSWDDVMKKLPEDYPDILKNNYKIWPLVQILNFYFIPLKYQVFVVQLVAVFWNTYISWKTNKSSDPFQVNSIF